MSFVLEQIAIGSRYISLSNRIFLKRLEKSMLSYWIRSSEDPDKQPYISSGFQQLLQESQTLIHSLMLWGYGRRQAVASQDSRRGPGDGRYSTHLQVQGRCTAGAVIP